MTEDMENPSSPIVNDPSDFFKIITSEIIAESYVSYNPGSKHHLGKILLKSMRRHPYNNVVQISASKDNQDEETIGSVLERSISTAKALRSFGLQVGDLVAVVGGNHVDMCIPFYASLLVGAAYMAVDISLNNEELNNVLTNTKPKIIFCDAEYLDSLNQMKKEAGYEVVTFWKYADTPSFTEFVEKHTNYDEDNTHFRVTQIDAEHTPALISYTRGTTGPAKSVVLTHGNLASVITNICISDHNDFQKQSSLLLSLFPSHTINNSVILLQSAIFSIKRLHVHLQMDSIADVINKYKPCWIAATPKIAEELLNIKGIDWNRIETFSLWGSSATEGLMKQLCEIIKNKSSVYVYGLTETSGVVFKSADEQNNFRDPVADLEIKLVDFGTGSMISADNTEGELWVKGPSVFKGYKNDMVSTTATFSDDGWFKTGDIFIKDSNQNYSFIKRIKPALKEELGIPGVKVSKFEKGNEKPEDKLVNDVINNETQADSVVVLEVSEYSGRQIEVKTEQGVIFEENGVQKIRYTSTPYKGRRILCFWC